MKDVKVQNAGKTADGREIVSVEMVLKNGHLKKFKILKSLAEKEILRLSK